jgi:polysaccharide pyruvyl transferase WcaK-like protein
MTNGKWDEQDNAQAATYENESRNQRTVTIPLREYDKLQEQKNYITSKTLIDIIDNVERLVRALRKHIIRHDLEENFIPKKDK